MARRHTLITSRAAEHHQAGQDRVIRQRRPERLLAQRHFILGSAHLQVFQGDNAHGFVERARSSEWLPSFGGAFATAAAPAPASASAPARIFAITLAVLPEIQLPRRLRAHRRRLWNHLPLPLHTSPVHFPLRLPLLAFLPEVQNELRTNASPYTLATPALHNALDGAAPLSSASLYIHWIEPPDLTDSHPPVRT